jgi:outer membrane murein-binding lipoprotein Lpp
LLKPLRHRLFSLLAALMFIGCLHNASLDESRMSQTLQPALSTLSRNMQDIREMLARAAGDDNEERLNDSSLRIEARASGDDEPEENR